MNIQRLAARSVSIRLIVLLLAFLFVLTPFFSVFADEIIMPTGNNLPSVPAQEVSLAPADNTAPPAPETLTPTDKSSVVGDEASIVSADATKKDGAGTPAPMSLLAIGSGFQSSFGSAASRSTKRLTPDVDPNAGALVYTYPLAIPPGRNHLEPNLNLVYNSQDNDPSSIVGMGWSIDIPYITRVNKTGVEKLYSQSYFASSFDGELVSLGSGAYSAKVQNGDFIKYSLASNVWTVTDKKGTIYKFGTNVAERQNNPNATSNVFKWMLQEVRDTNDNYIKYEYYKDAGQIYINDIIYTGHVSTDGIFEIDFLREARSDDPKSSVTGFPVTTNYRIYEIDIKVSGIWKTKYELAYTTGDNNYKALLDTITETGKDDLSATQALPVTDFNYQTAVTKSWSENINYDIPVPLIDVDNKDNGVRLFDVNGDGLTDVVQARWIRGEASARKHIYINTGTTWTEDTNRTIPELFVDNDNNDGGTRYADVNGDGLIDLVYSSNQGTKKVYINSGTSWSYDSNWTVPIEFIDNGRDRGVMLDDINGDGLADILLSKMSSGVSTRVVYLNTGTGWSQNTDWAIPQDFVDNDGKDNGVRLMDVNGDGQTDIVRARMTSGISYRNVYINNGNGWTEDTNISFPEDIIDNDSKDGGLRFGDLNGDGFVDVVRSTQVSGPVFVQKVYLGRGDSWWQDTGWSIPIYFTENGTDKGVLMLDLNGDSLADILHDHQYSGPTEDNETFMNNATKSDLTKRITYPQGGKTDVIYKATPKYISGSSLLNPNLPLVVYTVLTSTQDDGNGLTSGTTYSYEAGKYTFVDYTSRKFAGFGKIVSTDDAGNLTKTHFHQGDSSDSSHGEYSDTFSKIGKVYRVENYDNSNNLYAKIINKWDKYDLGNGNNFVKLAQTVTSTYDGDSSHKDKAESYTYDNTYGNLTQKIEYGVVTGSDDGTFSDSGIDDFTTAIDYAINTTPYIVSTPKISTVTDHSSTKVKESKFYYDTQSYGTVNTGNLTKQEDWKVSSTYINNQHAYNSYGLVTSDTDPRGKVTSYTYDTPNLYKATVTNPLSQETDYTYDYTSGQVIQTTDPNTRVYQNVYDGLDRLVEVKQPDLASPGSLVTKTTYAYTDTSGSVRVLKSDYLDGSTVADTYTYFDGLDRKIQERKEAESNYSVRDYVYNNLGLLQKESLPYNNSGSSKTSATGTTSLYTSYTYDPMRRIATIVNNLGTTTNTYADWKLTITDANSKVKDIYKSAYDKLVQVDEHNSGNTYSTFYEYNYLGNLTKITDALSNIRNFTYDGLGRRVAAQDLHDPADTTYFGTWTYTYDDAGNLTEKVDSKSQTIDYTYDDINRPLTENYTGNAGTEVTYVYDSGTDGKGHLTSMATGVITQTNTWNANNGLKSESKVINSTTYLTSYTYNRQGNQLIITNPDSSEVKYIYNGAGLLNQVQRKESGGIYTDVVSNFDYSPTEQPITISYQNGATTTNTYDSTKLYRLTAKVTTIASSSHAQDLAYTYDAVGNITQIIDASSTSTSKTANYTYDDLYRLTQAAITSVAGGQSTYTENYTYDAIGDIASKTGVGNYTYAGNTGVLYANPHAVTSTSTGSVSYTYDNNGNQLTKGSSLTNTWDYNNRITQSVAGGTTVTYDYDAAGQRIKYANGTTTTYYPSKFYDTDGTTAKKHIFALGMEIGVVDGTGGGATIHYTHTDHLTGSNIITNASDTADETLDYYPFGSVRIDSGSYNDQRKFTGQEYDVDTGLYNYGARYYNSAIGRFISQDPVFLVLGDNWEIKQITRQELQQLLADPQNLNSYAYARNNPLVYVDPTGEFSINPIGFLPQRTQVAIGNWVNNTAANNRAFDYVTREKWVAYTAGGIGFAAGAGAGILAGGAALGYTTLAQIGSSCVMFCNQAAQQVSRASDFVSRYGPQVGSRMDQINSSLSSRGYNNFSDHALQRMAERNISPDRVVNLLQNSKPFEYFHDGATKLGYYDKGSQLFVAQLKAGEVVTVITNASQRYVNNLTGK